MGCEDDGTEQVGGWQVDLRAHELRRDGTTRRLEPKVAKVLELLLAHRGRVVPRDELLDHAWPRMVVGDDAVTNTVIKLRRALGDSSSVPRVIETVPKVGYRLRADEMRARVGQDGPPTGPNMSEWDSALGRASRLVLRVETLGPHSKSSAGVLEAEIVAELYRCSWLRVVLAPHALCHFVFQFGETEHPEGPQILARIVDARQGSVLWSERHPIGDGRAVSLARRIAASIEATLLSSPEWLEQVDDDLLFEPLAWLLRGIRQMNLLTPAGNAAARSAFRRALALDDKNARAHACLAWSLKRQVQMHGNTLSPRDAAAARAAARRGFELSPRDPFVLMHAGEVAFYVEGDLRTGIELTELARARDPNFVRNWAGAAELSAIAGMTAMAAQQAQQSLEMAPGDPSAWVPLTALAYARYAEDAYEEAADLARSALWRNRGHEPAHLLLAAAQAGSGDVNAARVTLDELRAALPALDARSFPARYRRHRLDGVPGLLQHLIAAGLPARHALTDKPPGARAKP